MDHDRWTLTAVFDSIEVTIAAGVYEGGLGEAALFYAHVREYWEGLGEDQLDEDTLLEGDTVTATAPVLDNFEEPLRWLLVHTVPAIVTLERNGKRGI